jgi:hypothetical protein
LLFRCPKRKLCEVVPVFATLLANSSVIHLPEVGCEAFDLLMEYVESGGTSIRTMSEGSWDPISFFSLAEKFKLPSLQNLIMDSTILHHKNSRQFASPQFARQAYQETREGSMMSKYAGRSVRFLLQGQSDKDASQWLQSQVVDLLGVSRSFAIDFVQLSRNAIKDPRKNILDYHVSLAPMTLSGQVNNKRQPPEDQAPPEPKKQRINAPVQQNGNSNIGQIKQEPIDLPSMLLLGASSHRMLGGKEFPAGISATAKMVYEILLPEPQGGDGLHVTDIAQKSGILLNDVFKAGDMLLSEGLIYTTADDETWAILEY